MRCIAPILIRRFGRRDYVPCGQCNFCLQTRRNDWSFRLNQEMKTAVSSYFLTMTYDNCALPFNASTGEATLVKRDLQLFTKRLRKINSEFCDYPLRYYSVGEYGTRFSRPHYHSIMFNLYPGVASRLHEVWKQGNCMVAFANAASIHYVAKYVINRPGEYAGREPPFAMMSTRPGIGYEYLRTHGDWHRSSLRNFTQVNGQVSRLPRYFKDKLFLPSERKMLASEAVAIGDASYLDEVARLSKFHSDPYAYHDECVRYAHDTIKSKANKSNIF